MSQKETYEELRRQRSYHERKLIDELKRKRFCIRLASTLPSETDVQRKIRKFIREILRFTKKNHLQEAFMKVQGARTNHYARAEATLYRSKMEGVWLNANQVKRSIQDAMEGLAMAHEAYKFLVLAETATNKLGQNFYDTDVEGVSIEPAFILKYTWKEMDFFDELQRNTEAEMKNAEIQLSLEQQSNPIVELIEIVSGLHKDMTKSFNHLHSKKRKTIKGEPKKRQGW
uniref:Ribosomal protein L22 n=1 Tax=Haemonchus contortus TaxID=6289 RepID=A0A7I5EE64_HAECO|nr:unnamed protein product [Haemonchus contortus]